MLFSLEPKNEQKISLFLPWVSWVRASLREVFFLKSGLKWTFFSYYYTFSYLFELNISPGILKDQSEEKKYFLEWGLNSQNIFRAEIEKYFVRFLVQLKTVELAFEIN